jgi:hypothetical protein
MISKASGTNVCFSNKVNPLLLVIVISYLFFQNLHLLKEPGKLPRIRTLN